MTDEVDFPDVCRPSGKQLMVTPVTMAAPGCRSAHLTKLWFEDEW
jgi:hypothetical protein